MDDSEDSQKIAELITQLIIMRDSLVSTSQTLRELHFVVDVDNRYQAQQSMEEVLQKLGTYLDNPQKSQRQETG